MTSRERVAAAIHHEESDRIPIDLGGFNASTILAEAYHNLLGYLNIDRPVRIGDTSQFWVLVDEEIVERYHLDVIPCYPLYDALGCRRDREWMDWTHPRGTPVRITSDFKPSAQDDGSYLYEVGSAVYKLPRDGFYFDLIKAPYDWVETAADIEKIDISLFSAEELSYIEHKAKHMRNQSDKFIVTETFGGWCDIAGPWLSNQKLYIDIITNKSMLHALFEKMTDVWMKKIDQLVEVVGNNVDAIPVYNDMGSNMGGLYKNETVREMIIPYLRQFNDHVERVSDYHIIFHSCGSVYQYLPDLIDAGVRILNPVQVGAKNMEPKRLKREFGNDLVFWGGGVDPQHTLAFGSPEQVKDEARYNIDIFKKGGGFIFNNPHNIQSNVSPENIVALYEAANESGWF
jgi:uroporphyrinogen decarboxylase